MLALASGWAAPSTRADGDPASDVLATQQLFLPQDAAVPARQQSQLFALLRSAAKSGYPVRVAIIASPTDLGSVGALWRAPQSYAAFLGQELSFVFRGPLLVVMPGGFGTYQAGRPAHFAGSSGGLGSVTLNAIQALAAANGHRLSVPAASPTGAGAGGGDSLPWIAFAAGWVLVGLAWSLSLRARPVRLTRGTP